MSALQSARVRSQRGAAAAVERARLTLVQTRPSSAPRAPFAVLVFAILGLGVVGLLMFNTQMQQGAFYATKLQAQADQLSARSEALNLRLNQLNDPQRLAVAGRNLGMVAPAVPAFVNLATGRIEGKPTPTTPKDGTIVTAGLTPRPGALNRPPIEKIVHLPATPPPAGTVTTQKPGQTGAAATGPASAGTNAKPGRNKAHQKH